MAEIVSFLMGDIFLSLFSVRTDDRAVVTASYLKRTVTQGKRLQGSILNKHILYSIKLIILLLLTVLNILL